MRIKLKRRIKGDIFNSLTIKSSWSEGIDCDTRYLPLFFMVNTNRYGEADGEFSAELKYRIRTYTPRVGAFTYYRKAYANKSFSVKF